MAENGTVAFVSELPSCDFHPGEDHKARYDFRTTDGRWGNGCEDAFKENRMHDDLGLGKGQRLVTEAERKSL